MLNKVLHQLKKTFSPAEPDSPATAELTDDVQKLLISPEATRNSKFSVIIPTLWKCPAITTKLLQQLNATESVDEIIIIGNAPSPSPLSHAKVRILEQKQNIYVNPAWNLGVSSSANPTMIIINDDLLIPTNMIDFMSTVNLGKIGMVGISQDSLVEIDHFDDFESPVTLKLSTRMNYGYGICMFMDKSHYFEIPEVLKIYCGDSFLYDTNKLRGNHNLTLETKIKTRMSVTSGLPEFNSIKENEGKIWGEIWAKIEADSKAFRPPN